MSEQPWSREHPKVGVLGLDDWLLVQSASRTRDTGIVTLRQLRGRFPVHRPCSLSR